MKKLLTLAAMFTVASISAGHHAKGEHADHDMGNSKEWEIKA